MVLSRRTFAILAAADGVFVFPIVCFFSLLLIRWRWITSLRCMNGVESTERGKNFA